MLLHSYFAICQEPLCGGYLLVFNNAVIYESRKKVTYHLQLEELVVELAIQVRSEVLHNILFFCTKLRNNTQGNIYLGVCVLKLVMCLNTNGERA